MLGICVVYLVADADGEALLRLHLAHLRAHTEGPHRIYGVALRMHDAHRQLLESAAVVFPKVPDYDPGSAYRDNAKGSGEHSHYLDQLVDHAIADGCSHVATFDMDSWPLGKGWDGHYPGFLSSAVPVVAIRRTETGDDFPNPAFTLFGADFWRPGKSSFAVHNPREVPPALSVSRPQSGLGLQMALAASGRAYLPLLRSNRWNPHPVMCGIYDRGIFHFGAGSRSPTFATDKQEYDVIDTDLSRAYVASVNQAKRAFFIARLRDSGPEFIRQLARGRTSSSSRAS